jgi:glycosyltransferase involved in cell wall biosynthesis
MLISRLLLAFKMANLALRAEPDAVHAHDFNTLPAAWLAARIKSAPLVYDAHEVNLSREGYYRHLVRIIALIEGCLIRRCDRVITTTGLRARHFRRVYHLPRTPQVVQNRPRLANIESARDVRSKFDIPDDALLSIYQGGLQEGRGIRNMVQATAAVEGVHLMVLGGGPQEVLLRHLADELDVAGRVHFHPKLPLSEVPPITAAADVGLQLLRNTCFNHWSTDSNKLFEYVQAGVAVIASDFPEIRRIIRGHGVGLLVDPHSVESIAGALRTLRDDRDLLRALMRQSRASAEALSWNSQAPALLDVYRELDLVPPQHPVVTAGEAV